MREEYSGERAARWFEPVGEQRATHLGASMNKRRLESTRFEQRVSSSAFGADFVPFVRSAVHIAS